MPTLSSLLGSSFRITDTAVEKTADTGSAIVPSGTEAQRDETPESGYFRFNTDVNKFEGYNGTAWGTVGGVDKTTDTGSAIIPSGTEAQRDETPTAGYFRFNSDLNKFEGYNGTAWGAVGGGATGGGSDDVFLENGTTVTADYTVSLNKNALSTGPILIDDGVTITVPDGGRWLIL